MASTDAKADAPVLGPVVGAGSKHDDVPPTTPSTPPESATTPTPRAGQEPAVQPEPETKRGGTVAAAKEAHLDPDAAVLPLGNDVHPHTQAEHLDGAHDGLVDEQVEKTKAAERWHRGAAPKGTVIRGIEDDELWALVRRFNSQVTHTLSPPTKLPPGEPDLRPTSLPDVPFSSDQLKSNLERCYASAGVGGIYFAREMMRLMSWEPEERNRTAAFCISYFIAAWYSMVIPAIMVLLMVLTVFPASRRVLFPPVKPPPGIPPSATDPTNKRGDESMLSGVGHPVVHRSKAEQREEQAWEFTNTVQRFGMRVILGGRTGKHQGNGEVGRKVGQDSSSDSDLEDDEDYEQRGAAALTDATEHKPKDDKGKELTEKQKKKLKAKEAKEKRDKLVGDMAKATQQGLGTFADTLEMLHHALAPPPAKVYPRYWAKEKIALAIFLPVAIVFAIVPAHIFAQAASFGTGFGFFGQPLLIRAASKFVELVPNWQDYLDLRSSLLSKVPTDIQLTLHLLRERERQYDPLLPAPPPPTAQETRQELARGGVAAPGQEEDVVLEGEKVEDGEASIATKAKAKSAGKILGGLRLIAKKAATFRGDVTVDGTRAKVGNKIDRVLYQSKAKDFNTIDSFPAKLDGTSGHLQLYHEPGAISTLSFVPLRSVGNKPVFTVPVDDLVEIKKRGVFIARAVLGWAASINLEGMGLELRTKDLHERATEGLGQGENPHDETHAGESWAFSHVGRRDQLFARLLSIGDQKWETL